VKGWTPLVRSHLPRAGRSGTLISVGPRRARWRYVHFAARRVLAGDRWVSRTADCETCLVLLSGLVSVRWSDGRTAVRLGPRRDVFTDYPHALYLPPGTTFEVRAERHTEIADCRSPTRTHHPAREIRPEDCGFEVRGGGNATRQIIDVLPPGAPADRLLICEVLTPGGNWSSYPPHKHDRHRPPMEADLEETYYYRFNDPAGYGIQRLYTASPERSRRAGGGSDRALKVSDGDLVIVREGYHPFVAAHGYDAYYLNTLAGSFRSMAATDDPGYAHLRAQWPPPDPRVPLIPHPAAGRAAEPRG
jgi:5-deoxy-glucuronate isomerase